MPKKLPALALFILSVSPFLGCGKGTPVAPNSANLTLSANPAQVGLGDISVLTITATRTTGNPVNPGTEILLTTTLGEVPTIVTTDERGLAIAHLTAGQKAGTATVTAASGAATAASTTVEVGEQIGNLSLTSKPVLLSFTGGSARLNLFVLDKDGAALPGATVLFSASCRQIGLERSTAWYFRLWSSRGYPTCFKYTGSRGSWWTLLPSRLVSVWLMLRVKRLWSFRWRRCRPLRETSGLWTRELCKASWLTVSLR